MSLRSDRNTRDISNSPDILDDNVGLFEVMSDAHGTVTKDIVLETLLATIAK